jgi:putative spermidine/putrescine transport system permease protein
MLRRAERDYAYLLLTMILLFFMPFVPLLIWSFAHEWRYPDILPSFSWRAWNTIFSPSSQVFKASGNSLLLGLGTAVISQFFAYPAARALGLYLKRGKKWIRLIVFAPIIMPNMTMAMGIHIVFIRLHLTDTWYGVLIAHLIPAIPYSIYMLYGFYASYDLGMERQFRLLGGSRLHTFRYVELPLLIPTLSLSFLFSFLISWSQYLFTLFIGGGTIITIPMLLFSTLSSGDYAIVGALSLLFVLPALLLVLILTFGFKQDAFKRKVLTK